MTRWLKYALCSRSIPASGRLQSNSHGQGAKPMARAGSEKHRNGAEDGNEGGTRNGNGRSRDNGNGRNGDDRRAPNADRDLREFARTRTENSRGPTYGFY